MRKLLDQRILQLIKLTTSQNQRALFLIIGDNARDIVATLHTLLCNATHSQGGEVLWCYKKELATSAPRHIKRRKRKVAKSDEVADPLATFFASSSVTFTRYRDASRVLGRTFRMCVLQDFEGLTPNLLAQTVETVSGAGAVVFLLRNMSSLRQLSVTSMDFYARFRSGSERAAGTDEQSKGLVCRFIERFTLSLRWCDSCLVMDDEMTLLPLSAPKLEDLEMSQQVKPVKETGAELEKLKREMRETRPIAQLLELCLTVDQAKVLLEFVDLSHGSKTDCVLSLLASRGRGKTYACGLAVAYAILATDSTNIYVTSPVPQSLGPLFVALKTALSAAGLKEEEDFSTTLSSHHEHGRATLRLDAVVNGAKRFVQYVDPSEGDVLAKSQPQLLVIDEAAAIPLETTRTLLKTSPVAILSSTTGGYEGTGRSLTLKLLSSLRAQSATAHSKSAAPQKPLAPTKSSSSRRDSPLRLREATLTQPIRYAARDPVERWLSALLCLEPSALDSFADFSSDYAGGGARGTAPHPSACRLFSVDRDALFSGHPAAEAFLARVAALLCAAHYKNAPDDLQILSDAPEHRLFALVAPEETEKITGEPAEQSSDRKNSDKKGVCGEGKNELLPRVLCVLQVAFEGDLGAAAVQQGFRERVQSPGDLIPWTLATQYQEKSFAGRLGVRVVRLATHPEVQQMGYGSRAVELLCEMLSREEMVGGRRGGCEKLTVGEDESVVLAHKVADHAAEVPPLLSSAAELSFGGVSWIGVSFGLTQSLFDFWAKAGFRCVHLRQSCNKLTGEHSCIMLKEIKTAGKMREKQDAVGVDYFAEEFFPRLLVLLSSSFRHLPVSVALTLASSAVTSGDATLGQLANSQLSIGQPRAISPPTYAEMIRVHLREGALRRARAYTKNLVDFSTVADVIPRLAELLFSGCFRGIKLSFVQKAFFVAIGLQRRRLEELASELDIGEAQLLGLFNKAMRKLVAALDAELKEDSEQAACKR